MREIKKEYRNFIFLLILYVVIIMTFHLIRFLNTDILPIYDQYKYKKVNLVLPFVFGLLSTFLIYIISKTIIKEPLQRFFTVLSIIISPIFVYIHGTQNNMYVGLLLVLFGIFFLVKQKHIIATLFLLSVFALNQTYIFIVLLVLILFLEKTIVKNKFLPLIGVVLLTFVFVKINNPPMLNIHNFITYYVSDFGAEFGLGTFLVILFLIGLVLSWKNKSKNIMLYVGLISLSIMSCYNKEILVFFNIFIGFFAGFGLFYLQNKKWESDILKNYVLILIFCGLMFSYGSYIKRISESGPYEEEVNSLIWLSQQSPGIVLSNYEYGDLIKSISNFETFTNKDYFLNSKDQKKNLETNYVFQSRNLREINEFLEKNEIKYIWINKKMKNNIWQKKDQGILLILDNSKYFTKVYDYQVEIWEFNK